MSWLSNPFKFQQEKLSSSTTTTPTSEKDDDEEEEDQSKSVKEDLSELGKTISRQLWGVASFLAPPPLSSPSSSSPSTSDSSSQALLGIRNDFAEISGRLKSGLSLISTTKAVNEISKLASNLLQFEDEQEDGDDSEKDGSFDGGGISEQVLEFVKEMAVRPECWTGFPLSLDNYDFDMSDAQREHASTIERLAPSLADLRIKLCPSHMNEGHFWMIYFILLHPRLNKNDSELLLTAQIVEARDELLHKMQKEPNTQLQTSKADGLSFEGNNMDNSVQEENSAVQEKEVLAETVNAKEEVDDDQWLEEDVETGTSVEGHNQLGNEQDVSFSDLEDDDNDTSNRQGGSSLVENAKVSSPSGSSGWVQLNESSETGGTQQKTVPPSAREKDSEGEESNEWLTVDEFD